jgi:hypothetical protein
MLWLQPPWSVLPQAPGKIPRVKRQQLARHLTSFHVKQDPSLALTLAPRFARLLKTFFKLYLRFTYKNTFFFFKPHFTFKPFFNLATRYSIVTFNVGTLLGHWTNLVTLLHNMLYLQLTILSFGNDLFKTEFTLLNWLQYRYNADFEGFIKYNFFTYTLAQMQAVDALFVYDYGAHYTSLKYFKRKKLFLLALVPITYDPLGVDYALPIFTSNPLIYYYFFKIFFTLFTGVRSIRYEEIKDCWFLANILVTLAPPPPP